MLLIVRQATDVRAAALPATRSHEIAASFHCLGHRWCDEFGGRSLARIQAQLFVEPRNSFGDFDRSSRSMPRQGLIA